MEEKIGYGTKLKEWARNINLKYLLKAGVLVGGFVVVTVCSVANIGLDFSQWNWAKWAGKSILLSGIEIFGLLIGESIGSDKQKERVDGRYQTALKKHKEDVSKVEPVAKYLQQYLDKLTREELRSQKIKRLLFAGVEQAEEVVNLNLEELTQIHNSATRINNINFLKLNDTQFEIAKAILNGCITIECPNSIYFLTDNIKISDKSYLEEGKVIQKEREKNKWIGRMSKLFSSLLISIVWSLFTVNDFMDTSSPEAWTNLLSRIFALITSFTAGYSSAIIDVKLLASALEFKSKILSFFYNSVYVLKDFVPKPLSEIAREEVEKAEKEKEKRQVEVEIVNPSEQPLQLTNNLKGDIANG